jgi:hypothetical protein
MGLDCGIRSLGVDGMAPRRGVRLGGGMRYNDVGMESGRSSDVVFREVQRFRQPWLWVVILAIVGLVVWAVVQQFGYGEPFGTNPMSDTGLIVVALVFGVGLPLFLLSINLTTEVRSDALYYRFFPLNLTFRRLGPEDIREYQVRTYSPLREYGGWGIRWGSKGKAYSVSGDRGVELLLLDGRRVLIGSQSPEELAQALKKVVGKRE